VLAFSDEQTLKRKKNQRNNIEGGKKERKKSKNWKDNQLFQLIN
jgi:hypothetical protein